MQLQSQAHPIGATFGLADVPASVTALGYAPSQHPNVPQTTDGNVFRRELLRELLGFLRDYWRQWSVPFRHHRNGQDLLRDGSTGATALALPTSDYARSS